MAELILGEMLERVLNRLVDDLKREGVTLSYNVQAYASKRGMKATVQLSVKPVVMVCPECLKDVITNFGDWRNTPGIQGVRYVCPECFAKLNKQKEESDNEGPQVG